MAFPSPWQNPDFYRQVEIGGRRIKAALVAINGNRIEDDWSEQRPTGSSGATWVFKGTKPANPPELTFEAVDEEDFADLRELWEILAPVPGKGGGNTGTTQGSPGSAAYGKGFVNTTSPTSAKTTPTTEDLLKQAQQALADVQSGANVATPAANTGTSSSSAAKAPTPNPGPKPPTLSIVNGFLNYLGITAISRKVWEGPSCTPTNSYQVKLTVVPQAEPKKAAVGVAAPKAPDTGTKQIAFGDIDPAEAAKQVNAAAARAGAFT